MPSNKHNLTIVKVTGLIFVFLMLLQPERYLLAYHTILHGFIPVSCHSSCWQAKSVNLVLAHDGLLLQKLSVYFIVATLVLFKQLLIHTIVLWVEHGPAVPWLSWKQTDTATFLLCISSYGICTVGNTDLSILIDFTVI